MAQSTEPQWKQRLANIIFETNTRAAKTFDAVLLVVILLSVILVGSTTFFVEILDFAQKYHANS